jgi:hypothetical protein
MGLRALIAIELRTFVRDLVTAGGAGIHSSSLKQLCDALLVDGEHVEGPRQ